jgi:hypothetical protein
MKTRRARIVQVLSIFAAIAIGAIQTYGQTILSNETLVTTNLVVNKTPATVKCKGAGCSAEKKYLTSIPVNCPAANGKTCTFHIALDVKVDTDAATSFQNFGPLGFYRFLIDAAAPTVGPTDPHGGYIFERNVVTVGGSNGVFATRQSYPASVVTSTPSGNHAIDVYVGCTDWSDLGGCGLTAHSGTMRIDIFEP